MSEKSLITKYALRNTCILPDNAKILKTSVWPVHTCDKLTLGMFVNLCASTSLYNVLASVN